MKTLFTLFLSSLFTISAFAQYGQTVTVSFAGNANNGNKTFDVSIDGRNYTANDNYNNRNGSNDNSIVLSNLQNGQHSIVVNRSRANNRSRNNSNSQPVYSSTFNVKQGYDLDIAIKGNGKVSYTEKKVYNQNGRGNDRDRNWRGNRGNNTRDNRYPNGQSNMQVMSDQAFDQIMQGVVGKWLQSGKVSAVRDAVNNSSNYFSTYQVKQLLGVITSEPTRLELAKSVYRNVVDKSSFTQLYDLFSTQSSRDELDRFMRTSRY